MNVIVAGTSGRLSHSFMTFFCSPVFFFLCVVPITLQGKSQLTRQFWLYPARTFGECAKQGMRRVV